MNLGIDGNAALVAASSSGLGFASAEVLAREGADVMINGRDEDRLEAARDELESVARGRVLTQRADLTVEADVDALVDAALSEFGGLDHLVLNAGGPPSGPFLETSDEDWYFAYDLLVMSAVRLVRGTADALRDGEGGTIVAITSRSVKEAIDSLVLSNAVRMSLVGLTKTLSKELAPDVRANAVLPGPHETERTQQLVRDAVERGEYESYESGLETRSSAIPLRRLGDPTELGDVVGYLSSERSSYINGAAIPVEGGALKSNL
ncbi:SDR family oxidoreductase [Halegenticoccus tardaugens]|uniref:SDR family oxidoreductase n=1 Tax=Halegenticoccus tardaugens TaxID=2071624 RepID=UPI00100AFBA2|nr:SDR family oxidoreductase [Halegenticoccus tardaugens]